MNWIRGLATWVGVVLVGVQTSAAQDPVRTANIAGWQRPVASLTCACEDQQRLAWSCGDMVLVFFEGRTSVRFGRKAAPARPHVLVLVRSATGRYFVVAEEKLFEFVVEKMPDGATRVRLDTRRDGQPAAIITPVVESEDRSLGCASNARLLHLASLRDLLLTRVP